eukprot:3403109-Pyramimonas_sp.AAC.1
MAPGRLEMAPSCPTWAPTLGPHGVFHQTDPNPAFANTFPRRGQISKATMDGPNDKHMQNLKDQGSWREVPIQSCMH